MSNMYSPEFLFARIGYEIAETTLESVAHETDIRICIQILEHLINKAQRDMPRQIAELIYENVYQTQTLYIERLREAIMRADVIRMPHRLNELIRPEYLEVIERGLSESTEHFADPSVAKARQWAQLLFFRAIEYILRTDDVIGLIMAEATTKQVDYARNKSWGRDIAKKMDRLEMTESADEAEEELLYSQWWDLEFQLRRELFNRKISPMLFLSDEEAQAISRRVDNTSAFEILHVAASMYPRDILIGMLIDSGVCEINARVYVQKVQERVDFLKGRIDSSHDKVLGPEEKRLLARDEFADLVFAGLTSNRLSNSCSKADILNLCLKTKGGTLRLDIPNGDVWCARIAHEIGIAIGRSMSSFRVYNGSKKLEIKGMNRAVKRKRVPPLVSPPNVARFRKLIENITVRIDK